MKSQNLFPARLLGFGFYWAWLFLIGVSPSPIVGDVSFAGAPFEIWELGFRLASVAAIVAFARQLSSDGGRKVLLAACFVVGPLGTVSLLAAEGGLVIGSAALVALADAATFMLWLCFFGHMRVGETALYMALSYAAGALLCIVIMSLDARMALACAAALPVLSGLAFSLSNRFYTKETGEPSMFSHGQPGGTDGETTFPYMHRMACTLGLYALLFGLMTSVAVCNGFGGGFVGPYIEAPCCLVLGVLLAATFRSQKGARRLYLAYRLIPLLFAVGFAAFLFSDDRTYFVASACVMLAYLTFEITALNDFCNAVKVRGLSLVRVLGFARLAITGGILGGWSIGYATTFLPLDPTLVAMAVGIVVVVAASTLVFTEKEMFSVQGVADEAYPLRRSGHRQPRRRGLRPEPRGVRRDMERVETRDGGARPAGQGAQHPVHLRPAVHRAGNGEDAYLQHLPQDRHPYEDGAARRLRRVLPRARPRAEG